MVLNKLSTFEEKGKSLGLLFTLPIYPIQVSTVSENGR